MEEKQQNFDENDISTFENHKTGKTLPIGWTILFVSLIIFGIYYFIFYTPAIRGWTQEKAYQESIAK